MRSEPIARKQVVREEAVRSESIARKQVDTANAGMDQREDQKDREEAGITRKRQEARKRGP